MEKTSALLAKTGKIYPSRQRIQGVCGKDIGAAGENAERTPVYSPTMQNKQSQHS